MSRWVHIKGGLELSSNVYEYKGKKNRQFGSKDAYLPFPDEQLEIHIEAPHIYYEDEKKRTDPCAGLWVSAQLYSLPRAKGIIEKAFNLLPQGESGISYSLSQDIRNCYIGSGDFDYPCAKKVFQKKVVDYFSEKSHYPFTYKECQELYGIGLFSVDTVEGIVVGVRDDIRNCTGEEMLKGLENFFTFLDENEISVEDGYLEWVDEWEPEVIYAWRYSTYTCNELSLAYSFYKLDAATNKILWSRSYKYHMAPDAESDWDYDVEKRPLLVEDKTYE